MMHSHSNIADLRMQNLIKAVESILVFIAAIFANVFLPQLVIKYMYTPEQLLTLTEQPRLLELLPTISFAIAGLYFIYVVIGNVLRNKKASTMQAESAIMGCDCGESCDHCGPHQSENDDALTDEELKELESIVEEALKPEKAVKKATNKKNAKKKKSK